jgi:hypothetical protein
VIIPVCSGTPAADVTPIISLQYRNIYKKNHHPADPDARRRHMIYLLTGINTGKRPVIPVFGTFMRASKQGWSTFKIMEITANKQPVDRLVLALRVSG